MSSLVNRIRFDTRLAQTPARSKLSFDIDLDYGHEIVEPLGGMVPKALVKSGRGYQYVLGYGVAGLNAAELARAEEAKNHTVGVLAERNTEPSLALLEEARTVASAYLYPLLPRERADFISYLVAHDTVGYGPISMLMEDRKRIEEIEINAPLSHIAIFHVDYGRCATNLRFTEEGTFRHAVNKMAYEADKELGEDTPIIDVQVGNARVHAQIRPYAVNGAAASIRLADNRQVGPDYLLRRGTASYDAMAYLWLAVDSGLNIVIAGAPASGKTTMLSAIFGLMPKTERVVTIEEEVNELKIKLDINNSVALGGFGRGAVGAKEQVINALRMRPERLVIGEIRGAEARELFSGANLGVPFLTTMHSNAGGLDIVKKLITKPMEVETRSISSLDLALYMRHTDVSRRVLGEVYEYRWLSRAETGKLGTVIEGSDSVDVAQSVSGGRLDRRMLAGSKVIGAFATKNGLSRKLVVDELDRRAEFLKVVCEGSKSTNEALERIQGYE